MDNNTTSNKQPFCYYCSQPIKVDSKITSPTSGKLRPLNMDGSQHDCPNRQQKRANDDKPNSSPSVLSSDQARYQDTVGPMIAQILKLSQEMNESIKKLLDRFGGSEPGNGIHDDDNVN